MARHILAPVDFSGVTAAVVREAAGLAGVLDARLWLIHVAPPDPDFVGYEVGPQPVRDTIADELRHEKRVLERYQAVLRRQGLDVTALLVPGPTAPKILGEADRLDADLIVLGSHGHGALYHMIVGSVCEGVLRRARCPVVVVPDPSRKQKRTD
ncbi:MAG: universal stress protein [Planctomycetota bacterium]